MASIEMEGKELLKWRIELLATNAMIYIDEFFEKDANMGKCLDDMLALIAKEKECIFSYMQGYIEGRIHNE